MRRVRPTEGRGASSPTKPKPGLELQPKSLAFSQRAFPTAPSHQSLLPSGYSSALPTPSPLCLPLRDPLSQALDRSSVSVPRLRWPGCERWWDGLWEGCLQKVPGCPRTSFLAHLSVACSFLQMPSKPQVISLWGLVSQMPPEKLQRLYVDFPHHLRHLLGDWLENQPW